VQGYRIDIAFAGERRMVIQSSLSSNEPGRKVQSPSYLNFESDGIAAPRRAAIDELLENLIRVEARHARELLHPTWHFLLSSRPGRSAIWLSLLSRSNSVLRSLYFHIDTDCAIGFERFIELATVRIRERRIDCRDLPTIEISIARYRAFDRSIRDNHRRIAEFALCLGSSQDSDL